MAVDHQGKSKMLQTQTIQDNLPPAWNETVEFRRRDWSYFTLGVWDDDSNV